MDKKVYENVKRIRIKDANGTATFAERNWLKMQEKAIARKRKLTQRLDQLNGKSVNGPRA